MSLQDHLSAEFALHLPHVASASNCRSTVTEAGLQFPARKVHRNITTVLADLATHKVQCYQMLFGTQARGLKHVENQPLSMGLSMLGGMLP